MHFFYAFYAQREWVARGLTLALGVLLLSPALKYHPAPKKEPAEELFSIETVPFVDPPRPVEPAPPKPQEWPRPQPVAQPRLAVPVAEKTSPSSEPRAAQPTAPAQPQAPAPTQATATVTPPPPPLPAPPAPKVDVEASYLSGLRSYLNSIKRYPTGREASIQRPQGKARIWFVLTRDGRVQDAGVDESSDSLLLDRTALATVQRGSYPPFPDDGWSGQATHRFTVDLEFKPL